MLDVCQGTTDTTYPSKTNKFQFNLAGFVSMKFQYYTNKIELNTSALAYLYK